ncbi:FAD/NAD(P)-binding domain-containing protein [Mycena leptocephala]|nr:FAD/NAD(P)-binding domain-containing protein [Mycena leptocephala]
MSVSLPSSAEVCIVGAGPSGLACALGLAARNIPFVIALEALHPQLPAEIVAGGIQSKTLTTIDLQERIVFRLCMTDIAKYTKYAYSLLIPQHHVERRMREYVERGGHSVHWRKRVANIKEAAEGSQYELQFESVLLRSFAGIRFIDPYTQKEAGPGAHDLSFVVADVLLAAPLPTNIPRDAIQMMIGAGGVVLTAPIVNASASDPTSQNLFRIYLGVPDTPPRAPDAPYLQAILDARGPGSHSKQHTTPKIVKVLDSSRYRTRPALVDRYHGPAGGQGMNMGICDGCELAEAIDAHRQAALGVEKTPVDAVQIMDAYSTHRRAVAREVIDMVEAMTEVEKGGAGWGPFFRVTALWLFFKVPFVNGVLAWKLSGLGHAKK